MHPCRSEAAIARPAPAAPEAQPLCALRRQNRRRRPPRRSHWQQGMRLKCHQHRQRSGHAYENRQGAGLCRVGPDQPGHQHGDHQRKQNGHILRLHRQLRKASSGQRQQQNPDGGRTIGHRQKTPREQPGDDPHDQQHLPQRRPSTAPASIKTPQEPAQYRPARCAAGSPQPQWRPSPDGRRHRPQCWPACHIAVCKLASAH